MSFDFDAPAFGLALLRRVERDFQHAVLEGGVGVFCAHAIRQRDGTEEPAPGRSAFTISLPSRSFISISVVQPRMDRGKAPGRRPAVAVRSIHFSAPPAPFASGAP